MSYVPAELHPRVPFPPTRTPYVPARPPPPNTHHHHTHSHNNRLPAATGLGSLCVEVLEPHESSRPARLCFRGRASQRDLALMAATLQAAMQPRRRGPVEVRPCLG
jgi:hypothetical protein